MTNTTTPAQSEAQLFDEQGFRDWLLRNMPDDTIIGNSAWWADHLTAWAKRFVTATPAQAAEGAAYADLPPPNMMEIINAQAEKATHALRASSAQAPAGVMILCWVNEDELPEGLTQEAYNALFRYSIVDTVRMFPVFAPTAQQAPAARPEQDALVSAAKAALKALEAISDDMTVGDRWTNAGQHLLDALPPLRAALAAKGG